MPRNGWIFLALLCVVSTSALAAEMAPRTYDLGPDGKWVPIEEPPQPTTSPTGEVVANPELDEIEQLLNGRRARAARAPILRWIKANPLATDRDRGLFLLAEMYNQTGDKLRAFYHLDELMDYYPESRLFYPALEKQYAIADSYLRGYKRRFLGMPILSARDEGVEILFRIQERAPGSPIAERSLLRTADHYYDTSQFDLASDAYFAYARSYPRSPEVPRVRLRQAFASLAQFRGLRFDATPVIDAKAQLEDIQAEYPELAQRENVADVLERIDGILAARVAQTADFYRRTNEPQAAAYNWRYLIENYPDTAEAAKARGQLERVPSWALEIPTPTGGRAAEEQQFRTPAGPTDVRTAEPAEPAVRPQADTPAGTERPAPSVDTPRDPAQ
jgi:hypothetical protein